MGTLAKTVKKALRRLWCADYRLAVIVRGRCLNAYGTDRHQLVTLAKRTEDMTYWTLYKTGPLWLGERVVDFGDNSPDPASHTLLSSFSRSSHTPKS